MQYDPKNITPEQLRAIADSPAGKKLLAALQTQDSARLQSAAQQAARGEYDQLKKTLEPLLRSEQILALLKQLGG